MILRKDVTYGAFVQAYDLLAKANQSAVCLVDGKEMDYENCTVMELFEHLERVAQDDAFWARFPNVTRPSPKKVAKAQTTVNTLIRLSMQGRAKCLGSIGGATLESTLEAFENRAETPEEIRQQFYALLREVTL